MRVKTIEFIGAYGPNQKLPETPLPEIVFLGRSNVGKSSLINQLVGQRNLARTSNTPGRTRTANFYRINEALFFVDMPGYGYARVAKTERDGWQRLIQRYLAERDALKGVVQILDVRHKPGQLDREATAGLSEIGASLCLVFNKIDKTRRTKIETDISKHLRVLSAAEDTAVVPFSSETGEGKGPLWAWIDDVLSL